MSAERRQRLLLGAVAVVAAVAGWQYLSGGPPAESVAAAARRAAAPPPAPPADVRLEDLGAPAAAPGDASRNPFVFGARPVAAAAAGPRREPTPPAPVVFAPAGPPPLPPIPFKFIGLVEGPSGARIAVLSDSRGLVVHGGEGAIIDGRFRILAIGAESIDIAYADGRGRQTLRLTGQ
ncbi:MAG: hypothetical protein AB7H93_11200 [Vicinamibacterales bacterium]